MALRRLLIIHLYGLETVLPQIIAIMIIIAESQIMIMAAAQIMITAAVRITIMAAARIMIMTVVQIMITVAEMTVDFLTELLNPETMITKNNGIMLNTKDHPNNRMVLCK